ncbi:DNA/RNA non-specific endonuclease [Kitasatospora purpeofusca]|uniref:DNA/RNA non-specific endonuclease n=1 Tax=Kitasatospora purpeofusca TaxID=67352 RepID=UPI0035E364E8
MPCDTHIAAGATFNDTTWNFDYTTDAQGRPNHAVNTAGLRLPQNPPPRGTCPTRVGNFTENWGGQTMGGADFHGGHLIGRQFGGVGYRYNLVPQLAVKINGANGLYFEMESTARRCLMAGATIDPGGYRIDVDYFQPTTVIPVNTVFPEDFRVHLDITHGPDRATVDATIFWDPEFADALEFRNQLSNAVHDANC